jgi:hypothetical protein
MKDKTQVSKLTYILWVALDNEPFPRKYYITHEQKILLDRAIKEFKDIYQNLWQKDQWGDEHPPRIEGFRITVQENMCIEEK